MLEYIPQSISGNVLESASITRAVREGEQKIYEVGKAATSVMVHLLVDANSLVFIVNKT
jgi:hypothetical protein